MQPQAIVVLGDFRDPAEAAALVLGSIGFLPGEIETAADVGSLSRARVFAGYAGWGPASSRARSPRSRGSSSRRCPRMSSPRSPTRLWSTVLRRKGGRVRRPGADAARPEPQLSRTATLARGRW